MQQIFRRQRLHFGLTGDGTQLIALSLFMLLLAFFIVMNGIATLSPKKIDAVLNSVQEAFGIAVVNTNAGSSMIVVSQQRHGSGTSIEDIAADFSHEIPGLKDTFVRRTGVLTLVVPVSELNTMLGLSGARQINPSLQRMVSFLEESKKKYDVQLLLNRRPERFASANVLPSPSDALLPLWSDRLIRMGLPIERFSYGIAPGPAGSASLVIRPTEENAPQVVTPTAPTVAPYTGRGIQ